jgi:hypothetical protein
MVAMINIAAPGWGTVEAKVAARSFANSGVVSF